MVDTSRHWPHRTPVRREHDDELLGFVLPAGDEFVATTLFGVALASADDAMAAQAHPHALGLTYLANLFSDDDATRFLVDGPAHEVLSKA